jgi:hypothetical protein
VVNSSSTFQDVQGLLKDIAKGGDFIERAFGKLGKRMNKVFRGAQDLYVAEDDFYKIYNYLAEFDNLKNAYRGTRPDIELAKQAASIVRNTVPNYAYVSDFIKGLRRSPLGNFVSFPAEIVRTTFNITEQGLKELADPALRNIGARRLLGLGTTLAIIPPTIVEIFRGAYGITRDELAAMRRFLPEWSRESTIIPNKDKEGNLYYTDFSHGFAYDTVVNPIQSVIANVEAGKERPLIEGMIRGTGRALGRFLDPFVSESIWVQALNDLYSRGGRTDTGSEVWNPRDPEGDKMAKGIKHLVEALAPLSLPQISRTIKAGIYGEDPETGRDLSLTGELGGFFGFRNQKMDFEESLGYKISDYNGALRDSRKFLPRPRGNVDAQDILKELVKGNASWFEAQKDMKQDIEAMKTLGYTDQQIGIIFDRRGKGKDFNAIRANRFTPFDIPEGLIDEYIRNAEVNGYANPMNTSTFGVINSILRELNRLYLDNDFPLDLIREFTIGSAPPLPNMPMPNVNTVNTTQNVDPRTNLTRTETALLSPEEQVIASRT